MFEDVRGGKLEGKENFFVPHWKDETETVWDGLKKW